MGSLPNLSEIGRVVVVVGETNQRHQSHRCCEPPPLRPRRKVYTGHWPPIDDVMHQTAASSPASARSNLTHMVTRRRDSLASSIGATSIRRLISVVRNSHQRPTPLYSRRMIVGYLFMFCLSHLLFHATYWPFLTLQGALSAWTRPLTSLNVGSTLLTLLFFSGAISSLFAPYLIRRLGLDVILALFYFLLFLYFVTHLYPEWWLIAPANVLMGIGVGVAWPAQMLVVITLASKMMNEVDDEMRVVKRTIAIRRFARAVQASQDLGLIFGSALIASLINSSWWMEPICANTIDCIGNNCTASYLNCTKPTMDTFDEFNVDEHGHPVCGAHACPTPINVGMPQTTPLLPIVFATLIAIALGIHACAVRRLRAYACQDVDTWRGWGDAVDAIRDTFKDERLRMAAPLAVFIGLEQAFIISDFSKSYVVCTLGVQHLNLVFLSMGVLQSIAACTLSMLLKSIQRFYVVGVGFVFHACVLMVQMLWKPMSDDPALFYVIPAVWGVCNAIWELLDFSLLAALFADNCTAPFANAYFFRLMGLAIGFLWHGLLCNWVKLYVLGVGLLGAVMPFFWLEVKLDRVKRGQTVSSL